MYKTIKNNWLKFFLTELEEVESIKIVSPFINRVMVEHLLENKNHSAEIKVITRFNLSDFLSGVSNLDSLRRLVEYGAEVKGIFGLHSKLYIFGHKSVIIGSANFTSGGFFNNYEFGILSDELETINESVSYFEYLNSSSAEELTLEMIEQWEDEIKKIKTEYLKVPKLSDYGKKPFEGFNKKRNYFIKFFGSDYDRVDENYSVKEMIIHSHCHYALTFSGKKGRPRKYQDGDIVYLARILNGRDYAIFGSATTYKHVDNRDVASESDINEIEWRKDWPIYIRIHSPKFLDGNMGDCPKMSSLIYELKHECFDKIQKKYNDDNMQSFNPWNSLIRQADVQLSEMGAEWVENELAKSINNKKLVPKTFIESLYKPEVDGL